MLDHDLEPEIYSIYILRSLIAFLNGRICKVHLKIDTACVDWHRGNDTTEFIKLLRANKNIKRLSVFSHLAGSMIGTR